LKLQLLISSKRGLTIEGEKIKRRANGEGIYKRVGEKGGVYRKREKANGVFVQSLGPELQLQNREVKS